MTYKFPNMLGPFEEWPEGTYDRALRVSNALQLEYIFAERNGVGGFVRLVRDVLINEKPWLLFPNEKRPTPVDVYFKMMIGVEFHNVIKMLQAHGAPDIARRLETCKADHDASAVRPGPPEGSRNAAKDELINTNGMNYSDEKKVIQGNTKPYTLRRLRRMGRIDLLDRVEAGELSANAAAIEAGFRSKPSPADVVAKMLPKLSREELERVADMIEALIDA